jgi:hypothetical protein
MTGGGSGRSPDAEGLAWLKSNASAAQLAVGGGRRLQAAQTAGFIQKSGKTRCHSGCYERRYGVCYGDSRGDRGSLGNSSVTEAVTDTVTRVTLVWQHAGDICRAVRLRLNQSLMATTAEMRLRAKLGASQLGRSRPLWGLGAARLLNR